MLEHIKQTYLLWHEYYSTLPKPHRYTIGEKIDSLLVEAIEVTAYAAFLPRAEKAPWIRLAIRKIDTIKLLLMVAWEVHALDTKKYTILSERLAEIGRMLGGWYGQLVKTQPRT
ncbi:MAG TPA: four helix bundle protein [Candidatus Paceibacterota bacterium]